MIIDLQKSLRKQISPLNNSKKEKPYFFIIGNTKYQIPNNFLFNLKIIDCFKNVKKINELLHFERNQISMFGNSIIIDYKKLNIDKEIFVKFIQMVGKMSGKIQRDIQSVYFVRLAKIFKCKQILTFIKEDIQNNYQQYSFFMLFQLAIQLQLPEFIQKCERKLIRYDFQQINFNLYDLLQCNCQFFVKLLKYHKQYVSRKLCKGQPENILKKITEQYSYANDVIVDFNQHLFDLKQIDEVEETQVEIQNNIFQENIPKFYLQQR